MLIAAAAALLVGGAAAPLRPCVVQQVPARCTTVTVPEDRSKPDGRTIGLNVVVLPSLRKRTNSDAFTYLAGGPGGAATEMTQTVDSIWWKIRKSRDIVLVDQRGTGKSNPLNCAPPKGPVEPRAFVDACLRDARGDMRQYGTRAAADDLEAVRVALGYPQLNVYGTSYGATAAQVYLKRYPHSVRTMVLDGGTAIDVPFYGRFAANAQHALDEVAKRCAGEVLCRKAYPTWRAQFTKLVRDWNKHPVRNGKGEKTTGTGLAGVVQSMLLQAETAAAIPLVVSRAAKGDYGPLNTYIKNGGPSLQLMFWSIWCNEPWVGLEARGPWHTDFDGYASASIAQYRKDCSLIPKRAEPAAAWRMPTSPVPVLALVGGADPQDPVTNLPQWKDLRAIVVPGMGHAIGQYGCLGDLVTTFVARATAKGLSTRCVEAVFPPPFVVR